MAKPYIVRTKFDEEALISKIKLGVFRECELQKEFNLTRGVAKRYIATYAPKEKIILPSRKGLNLIPVAPPAVKPPAPAPAKPKPSPIIQRLIGFGCLLVAVGFGIGNAIMNYRFGVSFGQDETSRLVLGGITIAIDGGALLLFAAAGYLREQRFYGLYLWAFLTWLICVALSTGAALGFASSNIGDSLQARGSVADQRADLTEQKTRAVSDRKALGEHWSPQVLENQMAIALGSVPTKNRVSSKECTEPTLSAIYCSDYNRLKDIYIKAKVRVALDEKIASLTAQIAALPPISSKDPVAEHIAQMAFGLVTPEQVRNYLVRCFAIIPGFASILLAITRVLLR